MAGGGPDWDGLLKWSVSSSDGTKSHRPLSDGDRKWFMEAMEAQTVDVVKRMKEITLVMKTPEEQLESQGVTTAELVDMLDELQEHVEAIDMANDLHAVGGLIPLLGFLKNSNAEIRAKAADVVTTVVQNNPKSQELVMEANGMQPLFANFTSDPDLGARTKALGAISSLIRNNKPGIAAFRLGNGYAGLKDALSSESVRFQRKALSLLEYLLHENSSDCAVIAELGFPRVMMHLASSEDGEIREATLRGLLELARGKPSVSTIMSEDEEKLKQILEDRISGISAMNPDDLGSVKEERQLVDSLWRECYNEPSSLGEKGLLALPGENDPPPDVASMMFEPRLRAFAAPEVPSTSSAKTEAPLLLGLGPPSVGDSH